MKLDSVKDLEVLIKMLRKENVEIIKLGDIEIVLGKKPEKPMRQKRTGPLQSNTMLVGEINEDMKIPITPLNIPTDELTDEQKLFGSSDPSVWSNEQ